MRRFLPVLALGVAAALSVAACSDSDESTGSETTAGDAAPTSAAANQVVSIGVITPQKAGLTDFGLGMLHSVELAVSEANSSGALPGWTIKVVALDDSSDPAIGTAAAEQMIADESVVAIVGPYNSGVAKAMLPKLAAAGLPLISPSNTLTSLTLGEDLDNPARQFANYFRMVGADDKQGVFLAEQAIAAGFTTAAVVSETKAVSKGLADIFVKAFEAKGGKVTVREVVPDGATDFSAFLNEALPTSPGLIFFGGEYPVAATLRVQAEKAGLGAPLMGGDGIKDDALIQQAGAAAEGILASSVGAPLGSMSSASAFLAAYQAAKFANPESAYGPYAYDAANAIIRSLPAVLNGQTSPLDARGVLLRALTTITFDGASGKVGFDQYGDTLYPVFTLYVVQNGEWVALT